MPGTYQMIDPLSINSWNKKMNFFWSYAKSDNKEPNIKLTKLRRAFNIALDQASGFENRIMVDESDFKWGEDWKQEILRIISQSNALIALISPSYFNSRMCIHELDVALRAEKKIFPIYYRKCPKGLVSRFKEEGNGENIRLNEVSEQIGKLQYVDFDKLRNKDLQSEDIQNFLDRMAEELIS